MNVTALQIDRAEDMSSRLEGALYYMQGAITTKCLPKPTGGNWRQ